MGQGNSGPTQEQFALALLARRRIATASEFEALGVKRYVLQRLVDGGSAVRLADGLFADEVAGRTYGGLVAGAVHQVGKGAVAVLDTAAWLHGFTCDNLCSSGVWLAMPNLPSHATVRAGALRAAGHADEAVPLWVSRWRAPLLAPESGVEPMILEEYGGRALPVTSPARTCVDLWRKRGHRPRDGEPQTPPGVLMEWIRTGMATHGIDESELERVAAQVGADISGLVSLLGGAPPPRF